MSSYTSQEVMSLRSGSELDIHRRPEAKLQGLRTLAQFKGESHEWSRWKAEFMNLVNLNNMGDIFTTATSYRVGETNVTEEDIWKQIRDVRSTTAIARYAEAKIASEILEHTKRYERLLEAEKDAFDNLQDACDDMRINFNVVRPFQLTTPGPSATAAATTAISAADQERGDFKENAPTTASAAPESATPASMPAKERPVATPKARDLIGEAPFGMIPLSTDGLTAEEKAKVEKEKKVQPAPVPDVGSVRTLYDSWVIAVSQLLRAHSKLTALYVDPQQRAKLSSVDTDHIKRTVLAETTQLGHLALLLIQQGLGKPSDATHIGRLLRRHVGPLMQWRTVCDMFDRTGQDRSDLLCAHFMDLTVSNYTTFVDYHLALSKVCDEMEETKAHVPQQLRLMLLRRAVRSMHPSLADSVNLQYALEESRPGDASGRDFEEDAKQKIEGLVAFVKKSAETDSAQTSSALLAGLSTSKVANRKRNPATPSRDPVKVDKRRPTKAKHNNNKAGVKTTSAAAKAQQQATKAKAVRCANCGSFHHTTEVCRVDKSIVCDYCHYHGHKADVCRRKDRDVQRAAAAKDGDKAVKRISANLANFMIRQGLAAGSTNSSSTKPAKKSKAAKAQQPSDSEDEADHSGAEGSDRDRAEGERADPADNPIEFSDGL